MCHHSYVCSIKNTKTNAYARERNYNLTGQQKSCKPLVWVVIINSLRKQAFREQLKENRRKPWSGNNKESMDHGIPPLYVLLK